jgi:hypothetical protein
MGFEGRCGAVARLVPNTIVFGLKMKQYMDYLVF